jgi:hypothetical protein
MKDPTSALLTVDRAADWLTSGGQMGRLVRSMDWSKTPFGPTATRRSDVRRARA